MRGEAMKSRTLISVIILAVLTMTISACGGGKPATIEQAQPTAIIAEQGAATSDYFTEEFDGGLDNWKYFITSGQENQLDLKPEEGSLVFDLGGKNLWVYIYYIPKTYENIRIDLRADNRGENKNNISMICRYSEDEGWYEFNVANSGLYQILYAKWDVGMGRASYAVIADGASNRIKQGRDINEYTAVCNGRTLSLYVNGTETRVLDDNKYVLRKGNAGFGVASFDHLPIKVEVNWVKFSEP